MTFAAVLMLRVRMCWGISSLNREASSVRHDCCSSAHAETRWRVGGQVEVVDPVADYMATLREVFDFALLRDFLARPDFSLVFDAMHAVTGAYAGPILVDALGAPASSILCAYHSSASCLGLLQSAHHKLVPPSAGWCWWGTALVKYISCASCGLLHGWRSVWQPVWGARAHRICLSMVKTREKRGAVWQHARRAHLLIRATDAVALRACSNMPELPSADHATSPGTARRWRTLAAGTRTPT